LAIITILYLFLRR